MRGARFSWTASVKDGSVAEFSVDLFDERGGEPPVGVQPQGGTRIAMSQVSEMLQRRDSTREGPVGPLPPPKIPELDRWRDVTVIRGTWAFQGATGTGGPLVPVAPGQPAGAARSH